MFLYLNGINPLIEHFYVFLCTWNFILCRELRNKPSSCLDDSKAGAFITGKSAQHFKIRTHFGSFDPEIGEEQ